MPSPSYAFATAYLKSQESRIVTASKLEKVLRTSTLSDAIDSIRDTSIGSYLEERPITAFDAIDTLLWEYLHTHIEHLNKLSMLPAEIRQIVRHHVVKYDILNLKAALQAMMIGKKARLIPLGNVYSNGALDALDAAEDIESLSSIARDCGLNSYADILEEIANLPPEDFEGRLLVEHKMDSIYFQDMLSLARNLREGQILCKAIGRIIDLLNLQLVLRSIAAKAEPNTEKYLINGGYLLSQEFLRDLLSLKLQDIPPKLEHTPYYDVAREVLVNYEKNQRLTVINEVIDKHQFRMARETLAPKLMSPLTAVWYLILKELELRNMRLIAKALLDNIPLDEVEDFLVT